MKNILVPTDFSDCANAASEYAIQLAKKDKAKVQFFHMQHTPVDWIKLSKEKEKNYPETLTKIGFSKSELIKWVKKAEKATVMANWSMSYHTGNNEILKHILDFDHDFLVMGSQGEKGIENQLLGSNAQYLIREANVPVLIIKKPILNDIKSILFVSDFKDASKAAFHTITQFADTVEAHIDLLFINWPGDFETSVETNSNMEQILKQCTRTNSCTKNIINATSIESGINDFIKNTPIDLIAISTHGRGSLQQFFLPSVAEKVTNLSKIPVLSIKL